jgi:ABC-type transport system involved in multi-copper enzyme maturation permease subunit
VLNGLVALAAFSKTAQLGGPGPATGLQAFFAISPLFGPIGVAVLAQGAIVGEKQSGTAAWVLSKPVSRSAFILAKLLTDRDRARSA